MNKKIKILTKSEYADIIFNSIHKYQYLKDNYDSIELEVKKADLDVLIALGTNYQKYSTPRLIEALLQEVQSKCNDNDNE